MNYLTSSVSTSLLLIPSTIVFISVTLQFSLVLFYIFSVEVLAEFIRFSPGFTECPITSVLNSVFGRLLVSVSFSSLPGVLSYSCIWNVFLIFSVSGRSGLP